MHTRNTRVGNSKNGVQNNDVTLSEMSEHVRPTYVHTAVNASVS
jgi:hypothetical protein